MGRPRAAFGAASQATETPLDETGGSEKKREPRLSCGTRAPRSGHPMLGALKEAWPKRGLLRFAATVEGRT